MAEKKFGASEIIDPRPYTVGKLSESFDRYPGIGTLLPAMGYGDEQIEDLETSINNTECEGVIIDSKKIAFLSDCPPPRRRISDFRF